MFVKIFLELYQPTWQEVLSKEAGRRHREDWLNHLGFNR
jgi:hypothetical protein